MVAATRIWVCVQILDLAARPLKFGINGFDPWNPYPTLYINFIKPWYFIIQSP